MPKTISIEIDKDAVLGELSMNDFIEYHGIPSILEHIGLGDICSYFANYDILDHIDAEEINDFLKEK